MAYLGDSFGVGGARIAIVEARHREIDWAAYSAAQQAREVRPLCREVLALAGEAGGRTAVDLGCGLGRETRALLEAGWRVHAIDGEPGTRGRVLATTQDLDQARLKIHTVGFAGLADLPDCDLVYAGYSLPYAHPDDFARIWTLVRERLRPGGWFAGNLFGDHDAAGGDGTMTFHPVASARALFAGMDIVKFHEEEGEGPSYTGPRYWHLFEVIARRPARGHAAAQV